MLIENIECLLTKYGMTTKQVRNFIDELANNMVYPLSFKEELEGYLGSDIEVLLENAKYSKGDVQLLMKRRINRSHKNFFDRYGVEDIDELDRLVDLGKTKVNENLAKEKEETNKIEEQKETISNLSYYQYKDSDFKGFVGHEETKKKIKSIVNLLIKEKQSGVYSNHVYFFKGNKGTGKSLLVDYLESELKANGIIDNDVIRLKASSIDGGTFDKVLKDNKNGLIYISDCEFFDNPTGFNKEYVKHEIDDIVKTIDSNRGKFIFVLSSKEDSYKRIIKDNEELASKITNTLTFKDYKEDELIKIGEILLKEFNYKVTTDGKKEIKYVINYLLNQTNRLNAKTLLNMYQEIFEIQAFRTLGYYKDKIITAGDVKLYETNNNIIRTMSDNNDARKLLDNLVGLDNVKKQVIRFRAFANKNKEYASNNNLHMCFIGNPGTGKTEVGKIIAKILYEDGILPTSNLKYVTRNDLVAEYVGQTAIKTKKVIESSLGGVLFIDEAYSLLSSTGNDFAGECIAELVSAMEEYKGKFMVILAGYKHETNKLIESNTGLRSRINHFIEFKDYSEEELHKITKLMLSKSNYKMSDDCLDKFNTLLAKLKKEDSFGNARVVRKLLETLYEIQAVNATSDDDYMIKLEDIDTLIDEQYKELFSKESNYKIDIDSIINSSKQFTNNKKMTDFIEESTVLIKAFDNNKLLGEGTGFIISKDGLIVTNHHVIDKGNIKVVVNLKTSNNQKITKEYECEVIRKDSVHDLAILKINNPDISYSYIPLYFDNNYESLVREKIYMGGYPLGGSRFKNITINEGYIQSYNKDNALKEKDMDWLFIETSGGFPGNSGSGVLDSNGYCIGVYSGAAISYDEVGTNKIKHCIPTKYVIELLNK